MADNATNAKRIAPYSKISVLHDEFAQDGYLTKASDPSQYPLSVEIPRILESCGIQQKDKSALDLGCGPGNLKGYTSFSRYTGVDLSRSMLRLATKAGYMKTHQADVLSYLRNHLAERFDGVFCLSVAYFMPPKELEEVMSCIRQVAEEFWVITLDGITEDLMRLFREERGIELYNHLGMALPDTCFRHTIPGWPSPLDGKRIPMEVIVGKTTKKAAA